MPVLRPFFSFYGSKWRASAHYPTAVYDTIIEPFAGSAGYSLRHPERAIILVDLDPWIAGLWKYLIKVSEEEILGLPDLEEDQKVRDLVGICEEAHWLIGFWVNHGATSPSQTPSAWMRAGTHPTSFWGPNIRNRIASQLKYIRHWMVYSGDYSTIDELLGSRVSQATWFIDPPYSTKAGRHYCYDNRRLDYGKLADWCTSRPGQVIVCEQQGADWLPFEPWRNIKANTATKTSKEAIWYRRYNEPRDRVPRV